jgi:SAM-dependent methyltransferase
MGTPDYRSIGSDFLEHFVTFGELRPADDVLDVGCGGGRMAAALGYYLREGTYTGFDVHRESIGWCQRVIAPRHRTFRFDHVDLRNSTYNPNGSLDPAAYRFPYEADSFDFIIATSLFTHMFRDEVSNYLREFARVLRPGQVAFVTAFLLNSDSVLAMAREPDAVKFGAHHRDALILDPAKPSAGVALPEEWLRADSRAAGLSLDRIAYGSWTSAHRLTMQDVLLLRRDR